MARKNEKVRERKMPKAARPKKGQRRPHRKIEDKADEEFSRYLAAEHGAEQPRSPGA